MPNINERLTTTTVAGTSPTSGAQDAAALGALVLLALKGQPPGATLSVPTQLLEQLANAVVMLANDVTKLQGAGGVAQGAGGPRVQAQLEITSLYGERNRKEHLDALASKVRVKCTELGIKLNVELKVQYMQWRLEVSGEAPKSALDELRKFIDAETHPLGIGNCAKVDVTKYELV